MFKRLAIPSGKSCAEHKKSNLPADTDTQENNSQGLCSRTVTSKEAFSSHENSVDPSIVIVVAKNLKTVKTTSKVNAQACDATEAPGTPPTRKTEKKGALEHANVMSPKLCSWLYDVADTSNAQSHESNKKNTRVDDNGSNNLTVTDLLEMEHIKSDTAAHLAETNLDMMVHTSSKQNEATSAMKTMRLAAQRSDASKTTSLKSSEASTTSIKLSDLKTSDSHSSSSRESSGSIRSDSIDSNISGALKPHTGGDERWEAIQLANSRDSPLGLGHFRLLKCVGYGDIGSVYVAELRGTNTFFAIKIMDKASLASRNKLLRAQTEREILGLLDHPFLPTLYSHFVTDKCYYLVMEYCSGGNLHSLRQRQPNKYFTEQAARFYASEVLLALEYLHMLGIVYRDLKPENVLVRDGGHIMLSDFDLSLRCSVNPTLVKSSSVHGNTSGNFSILDGDFPVTGCMQPSSFFPRILPKKNRKSKSDFGIAGGALELMAEPTSARSMSFVGTHEYLAPEIICGDGHGSAVDWWTFGIFLYELLHGTTPFKGAGNRATLFNVVGQPLRFPDVPSVSLVARDLIRSLLVKDPQRRIAYKRGATEIKQHPFFERVNWALVRSSTPPHVPDPVDFSVYASKDKAHVDKKGFDRGACGGSARGRRGAAKNNNYSSCVDFEYF